MKAIKPISEYFEEKPLLAYILVVFLLYMCEFLNSIISLFPIEVLFLIGVLRAYAVLKIIKYLKKAFKMIQQKTDSVKNGADYKKNYKLAIIVYSLLLFVCIADVSVSAVSAICGLYADTPFFLIILALEYILDVIGITCLFLVHLNIDSKFRINIWWGIANIAIILCSVDAFLAMLGIHEWTFQLTTILFHIFITVFFSMRIMYAFQIQDVIVRDYFDAEN